MLALINLECEKDELEKLWQELDLTFGSESPSTYNHRDSEGDG
jgi:hypothetical protein